MVSPTPRDHGQILIYACSGRANVGEMADAVARELMSDGIGKMACLAGLASGQENFRKDAEQARINLIIDGCAVGCVKAIFQQLGLTNYVYLRLTDLGIDKSGTARATPEQTQALLARVRQFLAQA
mgnify:CR=1 FL=1